MINKWGWKHPCLRSINYRTNDVEPTKYYSLSAAARGCGLLKQMMVYAYKNRCMRIAR